MDVPLLRVLAAVLAAALASRDPPAAAQAIEAAPPDRAPGDVERLVKLVVDRHARTRSVVATFTQSYRSAALGQEITERGKLFVKRPGRIRFDYRQPEKKVFIVNADGTTLSYVPSDATAVRGRLPEDAPQLRLLMGQDGALDAFTPSVVVLKKPRNPKAQVLKLAPKRPIESVEMAYLEVDPDTGAIERVLVVDQLGNESDLVLDRVREDAEVRDEAFDLRLPAGVEVRGDAAGGSR